MVVKDTNEIALTRGMIQPKRRFVKKNICGLSQKIYYCVYTSTMNKINTTVYNQAGNILKSQLIMF